jgi:hypothetical protein
MDYKYRVGANIKRTAKNPRKENKSSYFGDKFTAPHRDDVVSVDWLIPVSVFPGRYTTTGPKINNKGETIGTETITTPYMITFDHWSEKAKRYAGCTAGIAFACADDDWIIVPGNEPCVGCYNAGLGKHTGVNTRKLTTFNIVQLHDFHWTERTSKKGTKYKEAIPCKGRSCDICKAGNKPTFARRSFWPLSPNFAEDLGDFAENSLASECMCGGDIRIIAYECPECKTPFRDLDDNPTEDKEEIKKIKSANSCVHSQCNYFGLMAEVHECDKCPTATPLTLWDTMILPCKTGVAPQSGLSIVKFKQLTDRHKTTIQSLNKPYTIEDVQQLLPLPAQAKLLKVDYPFADSKENNAEQVSDSVPGSAAWNL